MKRTHEALGIKGSIAVGLKNSPISVTQGYLYKILSPSTFFLCFSFSTMSCSVSGHERLIKLLYFNQVPFSFPLSLISVPPFLYEHGRHPVDAAALRPRDPRMMLRWKRVPSLWCCGVQIHALGLLLRLFPTPEVFPPWSDTFYLVGHLFFSSSHHFFCRTGPPIAAP